MNNRIVNAELYSGGVIIEFEDGVVVSYSDSLLRELISRAEIVPNIHPSEDDPT